MNRSAILNDIGRTSAVIIFALLVLIPLAVMGSTSFKTQKQIFDSGFSFLFMPTLDNYREVLTDRFLGYLGNSIIVGVVSTVLTLVMGSMCAYALSRFRFIGRTPLAIGTLLLRTIPPAVLAIPVYVIWNRFGIGDGLAGLILVYVAFNLTSRSGCCTASLNRCRRSLKKQLRWMVAALSKPFSC